MQGWHEDFGDEPSQEEMNYGDLMDYQTAAYIRPATIAERDASRSAAMNGDGTGVILVDGKSVYVQE